MSEPLAKLDDWAQNLAERIVSDIPHSIYVRWAEDVPERVAARLRMGSLTPVSGLDEAVQRYVTGPLSMDKPRQRGKRHPGAGLRP